MVRERLWQTLKGAHETVRCNRARGKKKQLLHGPKDWKVLKDAHHAVTYMGKSLDMSKFKNCSVDEMSRLAKDLQCHLTENNNVTSKVEQAYRSAKLNAILQYRQQVWEEESQVLRKDPEMRRARAVSLVDESLKAQSISFSTEAQAVAFSLSRPDLSKERGRIVRFPDLNVRKQILLSGGPHLILDAETKGEYASLCVTTKAKAKFLSNHIIQTDAFHKENPKLLEIFNDEGKRPDPLLYNIWLDMGQDANSLTRDS